MPRPKIRGVKPELWTDENFVELSPFARLLWIGLWNHACDNGHLPDKSKQIKLRILPTDDINCADLLREIADQGLIERAEGWITIPNLAHHQKPHKSWWATCEKPGCDLPEGASHAPRNRGATVAPPKRNRGATADVDSDSDVDSEVTRTTLADSSAERSKPDHLMDRFDEFWDTYGHKVKRPDAERKWRAALKKPGVTPDLLILAAAAYVLYERTHNEGGRYIAHPSTWLHNERWRDERKVAAPSLSNTQRHLQLAVDLANRDQGPTSPGPRQIGGPA